MPNGGPSIAPRQRPLSRERILRAALEFVDEHGAAALSMRKLAATLNVEAMSLYRHVENKDDVLRGVVNLVQGEAEQPPVEHWADAILESAIRRRDAMLRHREVIPISVSHGMLTEAGMANIEWQMSVLTQAGFRGEMVEHAFHLIGNFETGCILGDYFIGKHGRDIARGFAEMSETEMPVASEHRQYFRRVDRDLEFEFGMRVILRGLEDYLHGASEPLAAREAGVAAQP
ncbi:MAG: TetR family transcriptional regulator [Chloroflexi bacterium]|nr:TetR family transcriptional regulator [Chloroflexota bacterium]